MSRYPGFFRAISRTHHSEEGLTSSRGNKRTRRYAKATEGYWDHFANHRRVFDEIANELGIQAQAQWYETTHKTLESHQANGLVQTWYKNSFIYALRRVYPEFDWYPWLFSQVPVGFWNSIQNHKDYFEWLGYELGIHQLDDWYKVRYGDYIAHHGGGMLLCYKNSPFKALQTIYPEHDWHGWLFRVCGKDYWKRRRNQRKFFDWFADTTGIESVQGWYQVRIPAIAKSGGLGLLQRHYGGSLVHALSNVYPECTFIPWLFTMCPQNFWNSKENAVAFVKWVEEKLEIQHREDWTRISWDQVAQLGGATLLKNHHGLFGLLKYIYSDYSWDRLEELSNDNISKKSQVTLIETLRTIFPSLKVTRDHQQSHVHLAREMPLNSTC